MGRVKLNHRRVTVVICLVLATADRLTTFPIRMREDDFISFKIEELKTYSDVEAFLRRFERKDGR